MNNFFTNIRHFFGNIFRKEDNEPWLGYYSKEDRTIQFTRKNIYEYLEDSVKKSDMDFIALNYFGTKINYDDFFKYINLTARALKRFGVGEGDIVSICMPNMPEAIYIFYACNKIGAVADMIHPLSSPDQLKFYLSESNSKLLFLVDFDYEKMNEVIEASTVQNTVLISPKESMPTALSIGYTITRDLKNKKPSKDDENYYKWKEFLRFGFDYKEPIKSSMKCNDLALILHSGGTTGSPKGIMISNYQFNAEMMQDCVNVYDVRPGDKILTILPIFHGFGLCVCVHTPLCLRVETILMPEFEMGRFVSIMKHDKPNVMLGVPTMWEAMMSSPKFKNIDLSQFKYLISGGDSLPVAMEVKFNDFLHQHGCHINVMKGYGMTESVAATCYTFPGTNELGSIGIPMVGNVYKICDIETGKELPLGVEGEICVTGPTLMMGYLNNEKETNKVLKRDKSGRLWLHTGDIGYISPNGCVYYTQRLKRMIVVSGFNVYPSQIEEVIASHPDVKACTVIGIPHKYKMHVPKAFIVLRDDCEKSEIRVRHEIKEICKQKLSVYSQPKEYEFRDSLPKTLMNKVDYKKLEADQNQKEV